MLNTNYSSEMATANKFIVEHNNDIDFMRFLRKMEDINLSHSDKWSKVFDYMEEHYPETTGSLVTGIVYWLES